MTFWKSDDHVDVFSVLANARVAATFDNLADANAYADRMDKSAGRTVEPTKTAGNGNLASDRLLYLGVPGPD